MNPDYKFHLNIGTDTIVVHPIWKDDLALEWSFESNQRFRRVGLSGSLVFVGRDYDVIIGRDFDTTFEIEILVAYDNSFIYQHLYTGIFHYTDCTFNIDDKKITVKPQIRDRYSKVLAGLDKEYDLIKLAPASQPVTTIRRPLVQAFVIGDSVVSCFLSGMSWEQDISNDDNSYDYIVDHCHFGINDLLIQVQIQNPPEQELSNVFVKTGARSDGTMLTNGQGKYIMVVTYSVIAPLLYVDIRTYLRPNDTIWHYEGQAADNVTFTSLVSGVPDINGDIKQNYAFARLLVAGTTFRGSDTLPIPTDDMVAYNRNFKYCVPLAQSGISNLVMMSYNASETPTQWGVRPDGKYYLPPDMDADTHRYMPMAQSLWTNASVWYRVTTYIEQMEIDGRKDTALRDAFTLEGVINALLAEIDSSVTFAATTDYSQFLYGTNPLTQDWGRLVLTPKSNVLVAEYTQPARKAPVTLGKVLNMLRDVCGCYWFIDDDNRLRIEHVSWFKNGGSYSGTQTVGLDMIHLVNPRNGKGLCYGASEYQYDKVEMPERYEYEWMDDTTDTFKGEAIEVLSSYVQEGKIEDTNIDGFNADIDYMMLNPSNVSEDGFALLLCNASWRTQIAQVGVSTVQNWQLAMPVLQPNFLISDMPSWNIKVNGSVMQSKGIQRCKKQKIEYPCRYETPDADELVRTTVGTGEVEKMSIKLTSRQATLNLRFPTI